MKMQGSILSYTLKKHTGEVLRQNGCHIFLMSSVFKHPSSKTRRASSTSSNTSNSALNKPGILIPPTKKVASTLKLTRRSQKFSYVFQESVAEKLVDSILCNRVNPRAPVLEIAPGFGLVSRELLYQGVEKVIGLEQENAFHPYLQSIEHEYNGRFEFHSWDMLNIDEKFSAHHPNENEYSYKTREAEILNKLSGSTFAGSETPYSIFSIGGSRENHDLIFYILRNLPNEDPILLNERVEFFFLVHPKFKYSIEEMLPTHRPTKYTRFFTYFHTFNTLLYNITFHGEFNASDFVPSFSKKKSPKQLDTSKRHLVRMQLKKNISEILPLEHHYTFSIFLRHIFRKRKIRIIPVMEMLVEGCGLHMLADGFTMMETVENISPDRFLELYKNMLHWPEYSFSHFKDYIVTKTHGDPNEDEEI